MIRHFQAGDVDQIEELISHENKGYDIGRIKDIQKEATTFIVYEEGYIKGFAYVTTYRNDANETEVQITLYVESQSRHRGIGTALHNEIQTYFNEIKPDILTAYIRIDLEDPSEFCRKKGYEKWYASPELIYRGTRFPESDLVFSQYEENFFKQFVRLTQESFYQLQQKNDIKPFLISEELVKKYKLNDKENVYLVVENEEIMASVTIGDGTIENLMVAKDSQGKGYGRKALQFGLNKLIDRGYSDIRICYVKGNEQAENLYYSVGFEFLQLTQVYRKVL